MKTTFLLLLSLLMFAPLARAQYSVAVVADPIAVQNEVEQIAKWTESIATLNQQLQQMQQYVALAQQMTDYYTTLVKEHPERAVRSFMLGKMFRHEAEMRQTARQAPQAKEWLEQQEPTLKQKIMDRLEKINPFYREKALVREISREKTKIDFTQKPSLGHGMSV